MSDSKNEALKVLEKEILGALFKYERSSNKDHSLEIEAYCNDNDKPSVSINRVNNGVT